MKQGTVDDATEYFYDILSNLCEKWIPHQPIKVKKATHPWMNDGCHEAIHRKNASEDTPLYDAECAACADVLAQAYQKYVEKLKRDIAALKKNDKKWWKLNRELLQKKAKLSSIPSLRDASGNWHMDPKEKADIFASVWNAKNELPPAIAKQ